MFINVICSNFPRLSIYLYLFESSITSHIISLTILEYFAGARRLIEVLRYVIMIPKRHGRTDGRTDDMQSHVNFTLHYANSQRVYLFG